MYLKNNKTRKGGLLPFHRCKDDDQWLQGRLAPLDCARRRAVCAKYSDVYRVGYSKQPNPIKKENAARQVANSWLNGFLSNLAKR